MGGPLLIKTLRSLAAGDLAPRDQDESLATYAPRIKKADGQIDWQQPASSIDRQVRAFEPWPGAYTYWHGDLLKLRFGYVLSGDAAGLAPGEVTATDPDAVLVVGTGEGRYAPTRLQLAGRKAMAVSDFLNGFGQIDGARLG